MQVFARRDLAANAPAPVGEALLLEGSWPEPAGELARWSLDEAIDERHGWIDRTAADLAEQLGDAASGEITFAYLNALALRYYLVKLLRVIAFFDQVRRPKLSSAIELHATPGRDEHYIDLFAELARVHGFALQIRSHQAPAEATRKPQRQRPWRRWAAQADETLQSATERGAEERIVLCGNPHVLDPVCRALADRGCQVDWLYEQFAVRSWWRWRRAGVAQLVCDRSLGAPYRFSDGGGVEKLSVKGVDLAAPVDRWLAGQAALIGARQSWLVEQIDDHFRVVRPTGLVLDEDATPFKRAAVALARQHQARSLVVQHGAPCGSFGFVPQAADQLCAWGPSSREQLLHWGAAPERVCVTGWPRFEQRCANSPPKMRNRRRSGATRILLLATMPPSDDRPDTVAFHLTRQTHDRMLDMACAAVARLPRATLSIKLHPRCTDEQVFRQALARHPNLQGEIVQTAALDRLVAQSDCVLSCASTAGIEAALAGAPVVQLLPAGSGDILPAERWGLLGSARESYELEVLLGAALLRGWQPPADNEQVLGEANSNWPRRAAAQRIADALLERDFAVAPAAEA
jgi:hypothetical protein